MIDFHTPMLDIHALTLKGFRHLPLVVEGESKEVRYAGLGLVVIYYKPTVYSFKSNRTGIVQGTNRLRLQATKIFLEQVLRPAGIKHTYVDISDLFVLSTLVLQPVTRENPHPFRPTDLDEEAIARLPMAPPIEVVVKSFHVGTPKHDLVGCDGISVRRNHPLFAGMKLNHDAPYPQFWVRFDWRNPFEDKTGRRLKDEALADSFADFLINTAKAKQTALRMYDALNDFLSDRGIVLEDVCFFIAEDGETVFGEVSQDCGRFRSLDPNVGHIDKDVWRSGGSSDLVLEKWKMLVTLISKEPS
ncbi:MAG: Phosphoribosylaminoimidazolesuccinocarboxamide (SAICAR) synthase [Candidatus Uhrbacteria bacterium GW2011_GWE2_40_58]|nr:MAG: Phosphoribosylaminoimidazolesuccinocarboxamide (SAICAR) synthase [Candidatus Uhrbacteria bacterium GW2011_GWF2_40_263]KKR68230.1 MAG: Phosphoribosylaminoimidazolesuccinocarboxamide (SAICAR) synthase [Candidatus Uhrbacteria bacterium GW2011_GWE2_40_58]OGL94156.1 MAG: hypothetical protein A2239_03630 [Candidatus Uhrbacteria bacterium RIFOXYA2_FULL_40_9]OGL97490.1 MAG: hypothetical protein A2332_00105 [Candidatus Uhrbacteria bacterium RIFOXYB2_FULL_41_18]HBK35122.1 hypothetical protein [Ca